MKLKPTFALNKIAGETVGVPLTGDFHGVVTANESAAFILECLKEETSAEEVLAKLLQEYEVSREDAQKDLERVLAQLDGIGVLE